MQRDGYRAGLQDSQVLAAIRDVPPGAIAVAYVRWAAYERQEMLLPWTGIADAAAARTWASALHAVPWSSLPRTSVSCALV